VSTASDVDEGSSTGWSWSSAGSSPDSVCDSTGGFAMSGSGATTAGEVTGGVSGLTDESGGLGDSGWSSASTTERSEVVEGTTISTGLDGGVDGRSPGVLTLAVVVSDRDSGCDAFSADSGELFGSGALAESGSATCDPGVPVLGVVEVDASPTVNDARKRSSRRDFLGKLPSRGTVCLGGDSGIPPLLCMDLRKFAKAPSASEDGVPKRSDGRRCRPGPCSGDLGRSGAPVSASTVLRNDENMK
jgi:hypothetical protein